MVMTPAPSVARRSSDRCPAMAAIRPLVALAKLDTEKACKLHGHFFAVVQCA